MKSGIAFRWIKEHLRSQSGMGLAETLVAIAILGISGVCFVSSLSAGAVSVRTLDEQTKAQQILVSQMESLKGVVYDTSGDSYPLVATPAGFSITLDVDTVPGADNDLQKITAAVWHDGQPVAVLENYRTRH